MVLMVYVLSVEEKIEDVLLMGVERETSFVDMEEGHDELLG